MTEGVSLREALGLEPLAGARVVAGEAGLDRLVSHVNVMEVPDITAYVKPDQLLLTTTYPLRDEQAALAELVPRLAQVGLAGLAVKPARYIDRIPDVMILAARRLGFPLLELPPETSFEEITNAILGHILNAQARRLQRSALVHDRFTRIVLSGGGLREIVQALADLLGRPALIVDQDGRVLARSIEATGLGLRDTLSPTWLELPAEGSGAGSRPRWATLRLSSGEATAALQRIPGDSWPPTAIVVTADPDSLGEDEQVALEHAATVAALRLVQARAVAEADRRFRSVCLEELVTGHLTDRDVLRERALAFGWDLGCPRAVLLAELEEVSGRRLAQIVGSAEEASARRYLVEAAGTALGDRAIVWERSAGVAALVSGDTQGQSDLRGAGRSLQAETERRLPGALVSVGIGQVCDDPLDLQRSHLEALRALAVGRRAHGPGQVSLFEDLGLDRLLASCPESELIAFREATLGPLKAHDASRGTELVRTLEAFFECGGNGAEAARSLYIHYNTFKNRLERIEQLLGPALANPERHLALGLALRVARMLDR